MNLLAQSVIVMGLSILTIGCSKVSTFDSTSPDTIKDFISSVSVDLSESQKDEFQKAMIYFSVGGHNDLEVFQIKSNTTGVNTPILQNLKSLHGMSYRQIVTKYREHLKIDAKERAEQNEISVLKNDIDALLKKNEFRLAIEKYNEISTYESGSEVAKQGLKDTMQAAIKFQEKMEYINDIQVTEFIAKRINSWKGAGTPAVRIGLKNNGNKSLSEVKFIVYFKNKFGDIIYEDTLYPVSASSYSRNKPLKPGYVSEMSEGSFYSIDSSLSEWQEGSVEFKIDNIEFVD
tara:strand:+ start:1672 stop:2538 length:867 start_codon:yes stop_codon:yes gene_type:complete